MKKLNKFLACILGCAILALSFTACSSEQKSNGSSGTESQPGEKKQTIKLVHSYYGGNQELEAYQRLITQFETENPQYKIEQVYTDGNSYPTKLQTFFSSNTAPDIMTVANDVIYNFVQEDKFLDLTPYMEKDGLLNGTWAQNVLNAFTYDGKIIAAPQLTKPFALVYNKTMFDKAGLEYPKAGWSEEDWINAARTLTKGEGAEKTYGMHFSWMTYEVLRETYEGHAFYDVDNKKLTFEGDEAFKHAFEMISGLVKDDGVSPNPTEAQAIGGGFETGRFGMSFTAPWDMTGFNEVIGDTFEWAVAPFPVSAKYGQWKTPLRTDGVAISADCKNKDAAWEFVKFYTTHIDAQKEYDRFSIPALTAFTESEEYKTTYPENIKYTYDKSVFTDALTYSVGLQNSGVWGEMNTFLAEEYDRIIIEGITVDEALSNLAKRTKGKL